MKETARSLRAYFVIVGLLGAYFNVTGLMASPGAIMMGIEGLSLVFALAYLYFGAVLPSLLRAGTERIYAVLAANAAVTVVQALLVLVLAPNVFALVVCAVGLAICAYLYFNVKRLAAEARALPATQPVAAG
jgi:hypothetical protein